MTFAYQLMGAVAIGVSLVGTWLAARNRTGWLLCVASSALWFPALVSGNQWAAVANCGLSIGICLRNFQAQSDTKGAALVPTENCDTAPGAAVGGARDHLSAVAARA